MKKILKSCVIVVIISVLEFLMLFSFKLSSKSSFEAYSEVIGIMAVMLAFYLMQKFFKSKMYEKRYKKIKIIKSKSNLIIIVFSILMYFINIVMLSFLKSEIITKTIIVFSIFFFSYIVSELVYYKYSKFLTFLTKYNKIFQITIIILFFVISMILAFIFDVFVDYLNYSSYFKKKASSLFFMFMIWVFGRPFFLIIQYPEMPLLTLPFDIFYEIKNAEKKSKENKSENKYNHKNSKTKKLNSVKNKKINNKH